MHRWIVTLLLLGMAACGETTPSSGDVDQPMGRDALPGHDIAPPTDPVEELFAQARQAAALAPPVASSVSRAMLAAFPDADPSTGARIFTQAVEDEYSEDGEYSVFVMTPRRTKAALIYRKTGNLRAVQLLLGHSKLESTVRYLGVEVDDALAISEQIDL